MVFVRVHLIKGRLSAAQKEDLGAQLIQAVADVEGMVNNEEAKESSWVQFFEFDPENWYLAATLAGSNPDSRIQLDVITPQKLVDTTEVARAMLGKVNEAVRSVVGPGLLPAHGPWVLVHVIPFDQWALDGRIPDWEAFRAHLRAATQEKAEEALAIAYGPGRHTGTGLSSYTATLPRSGPGP
jgi:phenylpyruvate tautomerase PptA (4-oxalocrotonate tautomerase family)